MLYWLTHLFPVEIICYLRFAQSLLYDIGDKSFTVTDHACNLGNVEKRLKISRFNSHCGTKAFVLTSGIFSDRA
jgi:hypothetical protein